MSVNQDTSPFLTTSIELFKVSEAYDYWSNFWTDLVGNFLYSFLTSKERAIRIPRNILLTILVFITGSEMVMNLFTTALFQTLAPEKKDLIVSIISGKYLLKSYLHWFVLGLQLIKMWLHIACLESFELIKICSTKPKIPRHEQILVIDIWDFAHYLQMKYRVAKMRGHF